MLKKIIATADAPAAIGTYSQATRVGNTIWVSGQIPLDPHTKELVKGDIEAQIRRAFENLKAIVLARLRSDFGCTGGVTDEELFPEFGSMLSLVLIAAALV